MYSQGRILRNHSCGSRFNQEPQETFLSIVPGQHADVKTQIPEWCNYAINQPYAKLTGEFEKMDRRIRQNGLAHSPIWTSGCITHHNCVYIQMGWRLLRRGPGPGPPGGPEPQKPPARMNICTCIVYHACAGPFWRMRQSILANAPIHFIECAYLFWRMSYLIQLSLLLFYYYVIIMLLGTILRNVSCGS